MRLVHVFTRVLCRWIWVKVPAHVHIAAFTGIGVCTGGALLFHAAMDFSPASIQMAIAGMQRDAGDARAPLPLSNGEAVDGHMRVSGDLSSQAAPAAGGYTPFPDPRASREALLAPVLTMPLEPILDPPHGDDPGDPEVPARGATHTAASGSGTAEIPEPGSAILLLSAIGGLMCVARSKANRSGGWLSLWRSRRGGRRFPEDPARRVRR